MFFRKCTIELIDIAEIFLISLSSDVKQLVAISFHGKYPCIGRGQSSLSRGQDFVQLNGLMLTLKDALSSFRYWETRSLIASIRPSHSIWMQTIWIQLLTFWKGWQTSWTILRSWERLPSSALRSRGRFFTTFRRLRICITRWEAVFAPVVTFVSIEANYVMENQ